jgi:hypothetical protein
VKRLELQKELRIYLEDGQNHLTFLQKSNLFWFKKGYLYYFEKSVLGEEGARSLFILQQNWPVKEIGMNNFLDECFIDCEEAFCLSKIDNSVKIISIYQIGKIAIGRSRLLANKLRLSWQEN